MKFPKIVCTTFIISAILMAHSCAIVSQKDEIKIKEKQSISGLKIEYGPNLGTNHIDTLGIRNFYVHCTSIITNESVVPIQLDFNLAKEYDFPSFCPTEKFKAFILPPELTPDTATIYNNIVNGQHDYLNAPLDHPAHFKKIIKHGEYCAVTIGVLIPQPSDCAAVPRVVFTIENISKYAECGKLLNPRITASPENEISVKLEYYNDRKFIAPDDGCVSIPFGKYSFVE